MRVGPLSHKKIIELLNSSFVPVYTVNEEYAKTGPAPAEEKAERERIFQEGYKAKMSVGTVHVYILNPDGKLIDSLHVAEAAKPEKLAAALEKTVKALNISPGKPLVKPHPQSIAPKATADSLVLHLTSRTTHGGAWAGIPGEDWIVLDRASQKNFWPNEKAKPGDSWEIESATAEKILTHFYPTTENNDVTKNHFEKCALKATVVSVEKGVARARLEGNFKMQHNFYHKDDGKIAEATVVGVIDFK